MLERKMKKKRIRGVWLIAAMVLSVLLAAVLDRFGKLQPFWPIGTTIVVPVFTIWGHSELKGRPWFWATIAVVVAAHVVLFYFVGWPWGTHRVATKAIEGFCILDLVAIFAIISLIEKLLHEDQRA